MSYIDEIKKWQKQKEDSLRKENRWFTVSGLIWLKSGDNFFGADENNPLPLAGKGIAAQVGSFFLEGENVTLKTLHARGLTLNGEPAPTTADIHPDVSGAPDQISIAKYNLKIIQRGERIGIRVYDNNNPAYKNFEKLNWFPIDETYKVNAKFIAYETPREISITNILGDTNRVANPGYVEFELNGKFCRLEAEGDNPKEELFFNFKDATNGESTYGAGRFLDTDGVQRGKVTIDFNKCYNPPCVYTDYATCPLPPKGNALNIKVEAGEMNYK